MLDANGTKNELWVVPIEGGAPRRLEWDATRVATWANGRISVHPDGRQLAYLSSDERRWHLMVVENVLPPLSARRGR
jgi:hypothetical protein